jgi:hypothetical protein
LAALRDFPLVQIRLFDQAQGVGTALADCAMANREFSGIDAPMDVLTPVGPQRPVEDYCIAVSE